MTRMTMARFGDTGTSKNAPRPAADCAAHHLHRAMQKSAGAPDRDAPNAKIKCVITRACRACFGSNAGGRWRLRLRHHHHAPTYHRIVASVARLLRGNGRDRPEIPAVVVHGVITGTYKNATVIVEADTRIAGYGITARNYFGTDTTCD